MNLSIRSLALTCSVLSLVTASAFADGMPEETKSSSSSSSIFHDIPILGQAAEVIKRTVVPLTKDDAYSLMSLKLGAQAGVEHNSNIYRSSSDEVDDLISTFSPKLSLTSNMMKHDFDFTLSSEVGRYSDETKNNYFDWDAKATGRIDASLTDALYLNGMYRHGHIAIGSFEDDPTLGLKDPVEYDQTQLGARWKGRQALVHYELGGLWDNFDYDNVLREDNTLNVQDDRDRDVYQVMAKLGYEFQPTYVAYLRGTHNTRNYDKRIDSSLTYPRDSDGHSVVLGIEHMPDGGIFSYDFYVGYLGQNYDANQLEDVSGVDFGLNFKWQVTPADQLKFSLDREVKDTNTDGVSSNLQTQLKTELSHAYSEKLSVGAHFIYTDADYQTNETIAGQDRQDYIYDTGLGATYTVYPDVDLNMNYAYRNRDSNVVSTSYDAHIVGLSLSVKY